MNKYSRKVSGLSDSPNSEVRKTPTVESVCRSPINCSVSWGSRNILETLRQRIFLSRFLE